jgi:DNA-binding NtrC family response regulator
MSAKLLVLDDDKDVLTAARLMLKREYEVVTAHDPERLPALLAEHAFDVVLLDMHFVTSAQAAREGLNLMARIHQHDPDIVVVLMTAFTEFDTAVLAMKRGAFDFVAKPWQNEKLAATVRAAAEYRRSRIEAARLKGQNRALAAELDRGRDPLLGDSPAMQRVRALVAKAAPTDANVLVLGENGTGKELVARALHAQSRRADAVFMAVDLGAIAGTLIESELFGHRKGAFTGADEHRVGRFQSASGGTLFLDEVANMPRHLQGKLLTALERREVVPVGANAPSPIDVRVIAATNATAAELTDESHFRQDLLYRLNTVEIVVPPLRERREDIPLLATHFMQLYAARLGRDVRAISDEALAALVAYPWPGNIRALRHALERAVILCDGDVLEAGDFALPVASAPAPSAAPAEAQTLIDLERRAIIQALAKHGGNVTHAADELGLTRASLYRRMEKHGL